LTTLLECDIVEPGMGLFRNIVLRAGDDHFHIKTPADMTRKYPHSEQLVASAPVPLEDLHLFAPPGSPMTTSVDKRYVKPTLFYEWDPSKPMVGVLLAREAAVLQVIPWQSHPHLCECVGHLSSLREPWRLPRRR
jgi:hypothetical protein